MAQDVNTGTRLVLAVVLSTVLVAPSQAAKTAPASSGGGHIKCWHNKDGVRECGNAVPPEYAQQDTETKDKHGVTIGETGRAKTLEELEAERDANRQKEQEAEEVKKRAAQDRVLLDTFATEDDMVLTRDGQIAHLESQIHLVESHIAKLQKNLDQMIERAAETERRGEKPSDEVVKNIDNVRNQLADNHKFIDTKHKEQEVIHARFEADITRFRELKGITTPRIEHVAPPEPRAKPVPLVEEPAPVARKPAPAKKAPPPKPKPK